MPRKVKFTAEESVKADTRKKQEILRNTKIIEQGNRDIQTAHDIFADPNRSDQQKRDIVGNLESGFVRVERADQLPTPARDPGMRAADMFAAKQRGVGVPEGQQQEQFRQVQEEGLIPEEAPKRVELDVEPLPGESIPIVGPVVASLAQAFVSRFFRGDDALLKSFKGSKADIEPLIQSPEGLREVMLAEIQEEEFDRTISITEGVGAAAEAFGLNKLPLGIGGVVEKFTKTPSEDVETLRQAVSEMEGRASSLTDAASQGELGHPIQVLRRLRGMELELGKLEAQLKYTIILSGELRADPEQINLIEVEILRARETIFEAQQRAQEGAFITPSSESLFIQLEKLKGGS